jgi:outer membrane receptor protein involved in Fe transport
MQRCSRLLRRARWTRGILAASALAGTATASAAQEPYGRVRGIVLSEPGALVRDASGRSTFADADGGFALDSVPIGVVDLAAVAPGCRVGFARVEVRPGTDAEVRIGVQKGPRGSSDGLLTVTGEELRRRNFRSVYDALQSVAPYLVGSGTGNLGGSRSLSNSSNRSFGDNEPVIVLDGIRLPGASTAALEDFDVDDLERIEIARGPSAAWRFGLGGANGAVILTTRRPSPLPKTDELDACAVSFPSAMTR